jgi:hypothetical protein
MISKAAERPAAEAARPTDSKTRRLRPGMWIAVALVFALQIGVLFWLGNPPPIQHVFTTAAPKFSLVTNRWNELLALQDPTLFVLPHRNNFSGAAWLNIPSHDFQPTNSSEPTLPLPLSPEQLGFTFTAFMQTNPPPSIQMGLAAGLGFMDQLPLPPMPSLVSTSTVRVEGDLAKRRLLEPLQLPPQSSPDVLTYTEVQLFVDALGNVFSPVIIESSGNRDVDAAVLTNFAKNARFEPVKGTARGTAASEAMTFGKLIFEWQTVPPAQTNAPASNP